MPKIIVDWSLCDGNGVCAIEAPELFSMDDDDNLIVLKEIFDLSDMPAAEAAVRLCPKRALMIKA